MTTENINEQQSPTETLATEAVVTDTVTTEAPATQLVAEQPIMAAADTVIENTPTVTESTPTASVPVEPQPIASQPVAAADIYASDLERHILTTIDGYIAAMKPGKPVTKEQGVRNQVLLYRAIQSCINQQTGDFVNTFRKLLAKFEEHKHGCFHEIRLFRFFEDIPLSADDRKGFQRLLNLLKVAAPVQGRRVAIRQVNFAKTLEYGVSEEGRARVLAFFDK